MNAEELKRLRELLERFKQWTDGTDTKTLAMMKEAGIATEQFYVDHAKNKEMLDAVIGWVIVKQWGLTQQ